MDHVGVATHVSVFFKVPSKWTRPCVDWYGWGFEQPIPEYWRLAFFELQGPEILHLK